MSTAPHVVVVGGGLAGLAAAVACADGGARVSLFESRPRLGGMTWSFERGGLSFDNGQHVYLRCCVEYSRFLERLGSAGDAPLQERLALPVVRPGGRTGWIRADRSPAPLHLGRSLLTYPHLGVLDRLRTGPAVLALRRLRLDDPALDTQSFGEWLSAHGQSATAVEALWDLITLPTVNLHAADASLALAAKVFQTGLLTDPRAADIGWSQVPLARLHAEPAAAALDRGGAAVHARAKVTSIDTGAPAQGGSRAEVCAVVVDGERVDAAAVILAVPHDAAAALLPPGAVRDPSALGRLGASPIVNVHVVYDRRVTEHTIAAGIGTPAQFIFDRTVASGLTGPGQCLAVSLSAADDYLGARPDDLIGTVTRSLEDLFPAARGASVVDGVVTRERNATFRGSPGTAPLRPGPATGLANLFLAGAWTDTGWPATMESAVRSGNAAAALALGAIGHSRRSTPHPEEVVV